MLLGLLIATFVETSHALDLVERGYRLAADRNAHPHRALSHPDDTFEAHPCPQLFLLGQMKCGTTTLFK